MLLLVSVMYIVYLRIVVPYSRRDEMALEYFVALLDIALFAMLLVRLGLGYSGGQQTSLRAALVRGRAQARLAQTQSWAVVGAAHF